jgi:hypothetical protein
LNYRNCGFDVTADNALIAVGITSFGRRMDSILYEEPEKIPFLRSEFLTAHLMDKNTTHAGISVYLT